MKKCCGSLERDVLHPNVVKTAVDKVLPKFKKSESEWKLFNGDRLAFSPISDARESRYEFGRSTSLERLLMGRAKALVSPTVDSARTT